MMDLNWPFKRTLGRVGDWFRAPGRGIALALLGAALAGYAADPFLLRELRSRGFDALQRLWAQPVQDARVIIVDIDEDSLRQYGQWPWPRTLTAKLIDRIAAGKPRVLGIDLLFPEPDRLSPSQISRFVPDLPAPVIAALAEMPPSDAKLAQAISAVPTVLGIAPSEEVSDVAPVASHKVSPVLQKGDAPNSFVIVHSSVLRSLPEISQSARSEASIGVEIDEDGTIRNVPLVTLIGEQLVPTLAIELLRVAAGASTIVVTTARSGVENVTTAGLTVPTDARARAYLHFYPPLPRYISAAELFHESFDLRQFQDRIVIMGVTGLGLLDQKQTPLGLVQGIEIHAQLIESILSGSILRRPASVFWVELFLILAGGLAITGFIPYQKPLVAGAAALGIGGFLVGLEFSAFRFAGWLIDGLYPAGAALALFGVMLGGSLVTTQRERRRLAADLELQRQEMARLDGELAAARAIQMGLLPHRFPALPDRRDIDIYAHIEPARSVGGDLYDFLLIDANRLFFMIGDVSGKGIPAALFMATTKEVVRDAAARHGTALDRLLAEANSKIATASNNLADDGGNMMFVTAFLGVLDLASGQLVYSSAGHDSPLIMKERHELRELATEGGPPLGTLEDFIYPVDHDRLDRGAVLVLYTDGVTEAQDATGALYSAKRLIASLDDIPCDSAKTAVDAVFDGVRGFVGAAEQADDITVLALRRPANPADDITVLALRRPANPD